MVTPMNITTKYTTNPTSGAGKIVASGTLGGKRRQMTVPYNHDKSVKGNHGSAAGQLAAKSLPLVEQKRLDTLIVTGQARATNEGNGRMTFSFPD